MVYEISGRVGLSGLLEGIPIPTSETRVLEVALAGGGFLKIIVTPEEMILSMPHPRRVELFLVDGVVSIESVKALTE